MEKVILIDSSLTYTKIGIISEGQLEQIYLQNNFEQDLQNKIIQGQITDVVKNLQAVFVDFGGDKNGLLHLKQIPEYYKTSIRQGQRLPVQIMRENVGAKGHKLTAFVNIIGKHLVCLPFENEICISKKIKDTEERKRLKDWIKEQSQSKYGFIVRTSASSSSEEELNQEINSLMRQADKLMSGRDSMSKGSILVEDKSFAEKLVLDNINPGKGLKVICNDNTLLEQIKTTLEQYMPEHEYQYVLLDKLENVFKFYDVEKHFEDALKKRVWLKNGGNLVVEPTEALTVIDVNSAKAVMKKNPKKAMLQLNKLAVEESVRQIMKRNISGIIVIDLVDLSCKEDKQEVYEVAKNFLMQVDGNRSVCFPITELGLLQISRTKKYTSLYHTVYMNCGNCNAIGGEYGPAYLGYLLEQQIRYIVKQTTNRKLFIKCNEYLYNYVSQNELVNLLQKNYSIEIELTRETKDMTNSFNITYHV